MLTKGDLATSLATVSIAALGGPVPASAAALKEVVKIAVARYESGSQTRNLLRQVEAAVRVWARDEIDADDVELGLDEAVRVVARFGLSDVESAEIEFDFGRASRTVIGRASAADPYWGRETHYAVAERAIAVTYRALYTKIQSEHAVLLPAIQTARTEITGKVEALGEQMGDRFDAVDSKIDDVGRTLGELSVRVDRIQPFLTGNENRPLGGLLRLNRPVGGLLRLSWEKDGVRELILATDDLNVDIGRNTKSRVVLSDVHDSRQHGQLSLAGSRLQYTHLGSLPAYLHSASRELQLDKGETCIVDDKDRLEFNSGTLFIEYAAPDRFEPEVPRTVR